VAAWNGQLDLVVLTGRLDGEAHPVRQQFQLPTDECRPGGVETVSDGLTFGLGYGACFWIVEVDDGLAGASE
jgi:hypothetical protein